MLITIIIYLLIQNTTARRSYKHNTEGETSSFEFLKAHVETDRLSGKSVDIRQDLRRRRRNEAPEDKVIPSLQIVTEPPNSLEVQEGETVTLTCQASSTNTENIGYSWEYEDMSGTVKNMPAGTEVVEMNLEIEQMTADHVGWYQCSASDGNNRALSRKSKINLLYFTDGFPSQPTSMTVASGTLIVTLTCTAPPSFPPAVMTWLKNSSELTDPNALTTPSGSLVIHHVLPSNAGTYACVATNTALSLKATSQAADLTVTEPAVQTANHLPTAIWNDASVFLSEGDTVTITCGVYGEDEPAIVWYKGLQEKITDNLVSFNRVTISQDKFKLTISNVEISDTATYLCIATNSIDSDQLPIRTSVTVVSNLRFTSGITDKSLVREDLFDLVCEVTSNPPVKIEWFADGQKLVEQPNHVSWTTKYAETDKGEFATRSTLKVRNSNVDDTGLYQCFAYNDHQTAMDSASVFVSSVLQFEEVHFITPDTMFIRDGRSGLVECAAQGSPMPTITWPGLQSEYADLMESSEGTVGLSSTKETQFPIGPLFLDESGQHIFTCSAANTHAGVQYMTTQDVRVVVGIPAAWVNGTWPVVEVTKGDSAVLFCQFSGIPQPEVTWLRNGVRLPIVDDSGNSYHVIQSDGALLVESAQSADNTIFTCIGTNGFNFVEKEIQVAVAGRTMSVAATSGLSIGIILFFCLILLALIFLYRYNRKKKKVDVAISTNGNGVDHMYANEKALKKELDEQKRKEAALKAEEEERRRKEAEEEAERLRLAAEQEAERLKLEAHEKARLEEETKIEVELLAQRAAVEAARLEAEEIARLEAEEKARLEAEEKARLEAEEIARLEAEEKARLEVEEKARLEAEEKARLEAEEKARLEAEEKARLEAEEKARLEAEEKARLEAEEKARLEAEEKARLESEEKARLESEEKARLEAEEKARLEAEEKARLEAEEKARLESEEKARLEAEEKARLEAEETARLEAEEKARLEAEEKARLEAEEKARLEAEETARVKAEEHARLSAEERARVEAEEKARLEAEEKARLEAEEKARLEAEEKARLEAEEKARLEAEEKARLEAEEKARLEAEEKARIEAVEKARLEAEEKVRLEAEEKARIEAEEKARIKAEEQARFELIEKARLDAELAEQRLLEEEERIAELQRKEEEARKMREEEDRLAKELLEEHQEAEQKAAEKEAAREEAQRQLAEDTALAKAREEAAIRSQKASHLTNQDLAEREFQAAKAAETQAETSVKDSKSDRELEIANRMRDGALTRAQRATINKDLADATVLRDPKALKPVISKAEKKRVSGTENYLLQAKKLYEQLQAATQLQGATFDRRIADIESAIHAIKKGGFETLLAVELLEAQVLLKKLQRIQKAALQVQKLSQQTIAILKSYNRPPDVVVQVMRSVFLLLGNTSQELDSWPDIIIQLNKIGKDNTKRRIQCRIPEDIDYTAAKKVELILCKYDEELVFDTTQALGVFYNWAECIADERLALPEVLTEKHKSSGLFGAARPPPLPQGGLVGSSDAASSPSRKKKVLKPPPGNKEKKKKKGGGKSEGMRVGADQSMPPPPKFLYNDR